MRVHLFLVGVVLLGTVGCKRSTEGAAGGPSGATSDKSAALTIAGSTSVQPFAEKWAEEFGKKHPAAQINVQGGGSTAGVKAAQTGAAQIGTVSRDLKPDEAGLTPITVARDGIAIIVNPASKLTNLTLDQVKGIFSGTIKSWKELGGADKAITVITREDGSGTRGAFEELVMKKDGPKISTSALVQDSTGAVREMVHGDANAIGYISLGQLNEQVRALQLAGVDATEANVVAGKYPIVRPFLFVTKGAPTGTAKEFIDFVLSADGQAMARKEGLIPVSK